MARNYIVIDTEGVDTQKRTDGQPNPASGLFYDLGYAVIDGEDNHVITARSFINSDVFFNLPLMQSAYYAEKRLQYLDGMGTDWEVASTLTIYRTLKDHIKEYEVRDLWAYNARYDMAIMNSTIRQMSNGFQAYFIPFKCRWRDIWDYAGSTICNTRKYVKWCLENGYTTANGNPSTSADTVGKYLRNDQDYMERHTALDDAFDEAYILREAKKRKQKARHSMGQGWRDSAKLKKSMD